MAGSKKSGYVTIADVALRARVSAISVSRFFRNPSLLSAAAKARIAEAVRSLDYVPNVAAQALASARSDVIGVIIPSVTNSVYSDVLRGMYDAIEGSGFALQLSNSRYQLQEEERLIRLFTAQKPAGLVITGIDQLPSAREMLERVACPVVQIMDVGPEPVDMMIGFSHFPAGYEAARHLVEAGYRRIGLMGATMDGRTRKRLEGAQRMLSDSGLLDERLIVTTSAFSTLALGSELFQQLLTAAPDMDAVFCVNDDLAAGVLFECQRRGISVPLQMGIAGYNDLEIAASTVPSITSVRTRRYEMGLLAIRMVLDAINGNGVEPRVVDLGFEVVARASTDPSGAIAPTDYSLTSGPSGLP
jgi:LacI family gluconate utilization system Gnt-I transcriptional repressor